MRRRWQIVETVGKWWVGMPVTSQRRPNNFKTLFGPTEIILMAHYWEVVGWYTNDKFEEAQPEAIVGKWLVWARLAKRTFPTVGQQSLRNLLVLAQLLCATWVLFHSIMVHL